MSTTIAVIGAGKTGRGFVARLISESGHSFTLIDRDKELIRTLRREKSYSVDFFKGMREQYVIDTYEAFHTEEDECVKILSAADLVFISVGGKNLEDVSKTLYESMALRVSTGVQKVCNIITCENAHKPAEKLKARVKKYCTREEAEHIDNFYGFSESTIFCSTIEKSSEGLAILSEDYNNLQYDSKAARGSLPGIKALVPIDKFENFLSRKLYTYNAASAVIAYLGYLKGYKLYGEAGNDEDIVNVLKRLYEEVGRALCMEYGYDPKDQAEFALMSLKKFQDTSIVDTIERNARDVIRKLAPDDRLIGPARLVYKHGEAPRALALIIAAALMYDSPSEETFNGMKETGGISGILKEVCELDGESGLAEMVMDYHDMILKEGPDCSFSKILK